MSRRRVPSWALPAVAVVDAFLSALWMTKYELLYVPDEWAPALSAVVLGLTLGVVLLLRGRP